MYPQDVLDIVDRASDVMNMSTEKAERVVNELSSIRMKYSNKKRNILTSNLHFAQAFLIFSVNWEIELSSHKEKNLGEY